MARGVLAQLLPGGKRFFARRNPLESRGAPRLNAARAGSAPRAGAGRRDPFASSGVGQIACGTRMCARHAAQTLRAIMARRPGFTLVELLVSLAILAVLLAALVPVVGAARA